MYGIGLLQGLSVTFKRMFSKPTTVQYPEERLPVGPLFRGGCIKLDEQKCISCGLCAMACPNSAIDLASEKTESGKKALTRYIHQLPVCLYCNYCIEACPTKAISWTANYEMSSWTHEELNIDCLAAAKEGKE